MFDRFKTYIAPYAEKLENILKIGSYTKVSGSDGTLQEIQLKTLRNIEDAMKVGQFGFNSKAPLESRCIVAKIGNEKIVVANEHQASIIDVDSGDTVIYNESGHTIKIQGDTITTTAPNIEAECTNFTVTTGVFTINATDTNITTDTLDITATATEFTGGTITHDGTAIDKTHTHTQGNDSANDVQQPTNTPS